MKRILCTMLAAALGVFSLCSCGNETKTEAPAQSQTETAEETSVAQTAEEEPEESEAGGLLAELENEADAETPKGNAAKFTMTAEQLGEALEGTWVNQSDFTDKLRFEKDLAAIHFMGEEQHDGSVEIKESGMMTLSFDGDETMAHKTYIWVDNMSNANSNTWYIDSGTFACGSKTYIRDLGI